MALSDGTRSAITYGSAAIVVGALGAASLGWWVPELRRQAVAAPGERIEVAFIDAPVWMAPQDLAPLQEMTAREAGPTAGGREGLLRAKAALERSGWFDEVRQVSRSGFSGIEVDATFAEPAALVVHSNAEHLLDTSCRRMPRSYPVGMGPRLTRILGVAAPPPAHAGSAWSGADVIAGVEMAKLVGVQRWRGQVEAVDVGDFASSGNVALLTTKQSRIIWGRMPGTEAAAEVPSAQKLRYLDMLMSQYGRIDGAGPQSIDLSVDYVGSR
ncbi:MAG: hypothetical protein FJ256_03330 [Phycisphaerae bacterium]|nr:hypothetical protein [Phycisphaerae bacterium]